MGIDYVMGFKDAVKAVEMETNSIIKGIKVGSREEMANAIDSFISTVYVLRLEYEKLEEDMLEEMEEEIECEECDFINMCEKLNKHIEKLFKEEI